ncbi:MAG: alpha-E domain-containing protein [Steroidobacteraceae bacterium]|jgi:uncharacterized alpha-E superfamily protein|nr:alpha-E domain-containing protein [Steroidobacteraceae bacterium]
MLARVVENVYWLARYLERAENTARLVNVNTNLVLDLPAGFAPGWMLLVDISGGREVFDALGGRAEDANTERRVVRFLLSERQNAGSLVSSLRMAHENARTLREVLPSEVSEQLNEFYAEFTRDIANGINKRTRFEFLKQTVLRLQTLAGQLDGTMNRNDAFTFLQIGRNLERADMTSRIVDVRSAQLLPAETPELRPFDTVQWMSVLKSLSGYQMYRLRMRSRVRRADVMQFLLRDDQFPRACGFCLERISDALRGLPRSAEVLALLDDAARFLGVANLETLDQAGLHELVDRLQLEIQGIHDGIAKSYFPSRDGANRPLLAARAGEPAQSQSSR